MTDRLARLRAGHPPPDRTGDTTRDFTVSMPPASSSETSSPSQRYVAPGNGAGRRSREGTYASTDSTAGDPSAGWCGDTTVAHSPRISARTFARLLPGIPVLKVR